MNKRPVSYLQTDPRWRSMDYSAPGEKTTIGGSGCGPTAAAMLIETLTGKKFTPVDACAWSLAHGFKALRQGTYYAYFKPQFAEFGISCRQLNGSNIYGKKNSSVHAEAFALLKQGYYLIACMGKGLWTSSGHFIVVWWQDGKVRINDPASTRQERLNGDLDKFKSQVKYYWAIDARAYNKAEEDDDVDVNRFRELWMEMRAEFQDNDKSEYSEQARAWAKETGLVKGGAPLPDGKPNYMWEDVMTREQFVTVLYRFAQMMGKA